MTSHNCTGLTTLPTAIIPNTCAIPFFTDDTRSAVTSCCGVGAPVIEWLSSSDQSCSLLCPAADQTIDQLSSCLQSVDLEHDIQITCSGLASDSASTADIALAYHHANKNDGWCTSCSPESNAQDNMLDPSTLGQAIMSTDGDVSSPAQEKEKRSAANTLGLLRKENREGTRITATVIALLLVGSAMGTFC